MLAGSYTVSNKRRVNGCSSAEKRSDFFTFQGVGDGKDELLVDSDHAGVAALGEDSVGVRSVVGVDLTIGVSVAKV
jgi:hypothetical protein